MSIAGRSRAAEVAVKGIHAGLRLGAVAPEQRAARRLRSEAALLPPPTGPRTLVLSPRDWAVHVQWDAMIAHALRLRGADVQIATCGGGLAICDRANTWEAPPMPCRTCSHYTESSFAAHGLPLIELTSLSRPSPWPELDGIGLTDLRTIVEDGLELGRLVEIPVSWFLMRSDLENDPLAARTYREFLRSARRLAAASHSLLDRVQPDVVVACNGLFLFESVLWAVCRQRGIPVVTYERGFIKETLVVDVDDAAPLFHFDEEWAVARRRPLDAGEEVTLDSYLEDRRHGRRTIDRFWVSPDFTAPSAAVEGGRLVSLFTNLTWDSAVIGQERAFSSIQEWLVAAVRLFAPRPSDRLVIRVHPAELKLPGKQTREPMAQVLQERIGALPGNVRLVGAADDLSSYPLMEQSDLGLVYTSTTGLEMAALGKPVVVAGRTHYGGKGFTHDAVDPADFEARVLRLLDDPAAGLPDRELARRYAHFFWFEAPVRSPGVEEHLPGLARLVVGSLDELRPGQHVGADRICDLVLAAAAKRLASSGGGRPAGQQDEGGRGALDPGLA